MNEELDMYFIEVMDKFGTIGGNGRCVTWLLSQLSTFPPACAIFFSQMLLGTFDATPSIFFCHYG